MLDYNDGEDMNLVLLLKDSSLRTSKNGKQYLVLQFSDSSGTIRGNLWNASQQDADTFSPGTIVELSGRREEYQDRPQIRIYDLRVVGPNEGYDLSQFVHSAPIKQKDLEEEINKRVLRS